MMDNNEKAQALLESDLDKVAVYLSRCGQQSNQELLMKGYPDIGWDPVEGERFLDFFRFCVWVNGKIWMCKTKYLCIFACYICILLIV
jgi:ryanodine receptor 2